jgi:hypothetical protein
MLGRNLPGEMCGGNGSIAFFWKLKDLSREKETEARAGFEFERRQATQATTQLFETSVRAKQWMR